MDNDFPAVMANGGEVKILGFVDGVSTTGIIDAMVSKQGEHE